MSDKLNLACGQSRKEGFTGVDIAATPAVDVVHDLLVAPWPFDSNTVSEVYCSHFIEHIPMQTFGGKDLFFLFFDEMYRVMKVGGSATIIAPYGASDRAFQDPTHRRFIVPSTFVYLNRKWRKDNNLHHYNVECNFDVKIELSYAGEFDLKHETAKAWSGLHYWNAVQDLTATLTKLED